jgi:2-keto-4-pentenoate hydratase
LTEPVETAAVRLLQAIKTGRPCQPIRDLIASDDLDAAYAVQEYNTRFFLKEHRRLVGRKIGLTSVAVQKQLGVDQPDFGMLFADMQSDDASTIPYAILMQPKIEAEVALVLAKSLTKSRHSIADVIDATAYAVAALEIVGSRIADWDIRLADTIADNASSSRFVLGRAHRNLDDLDLVKCTMTMEKAGKQVSAGSGADCMGSPLNAAVWLADVMVRVGHPLSVGDIVLTGALGPMVSVERGDVIEARIDGLGSVSARFGKE